MFEERRKVFIKLPYSHDNEKLSKRFINKLNTFTDGRFMLIILWQKRNINRYSILKINSGTDQMSSIVPSAHAAKSTLGKQRETLQCERQNTRTSLIFPNQPVTSHNTQPMHTHGTSRAEINNGGPANCLRETNPKRPKQTSRLFHCETFPLGNTFIDQNQVVCKFPPCTTADDRTVENVFFFFNFSIL